MTTYDPLRSSIARFTGPLPDRPWPQPEAIDALLRQCCQLLFGHCRADHRSWLSESDLRSLLYATLQRELPSYGIPSCALHSNYPIKQTPERMEELGRRGRVLHVDLALVVPSTIRSLRGRHWEADLAAVIVVKRGCTRLREIRAALDKLASLRITHAKSQSLMVIMGYRSKQEKLASAKRAAERAEIPLLLDNYWGPGDETGERSRTDQPELV